MRRSPCCVTERSQASGTPDVLAKRDHAAMLRKLGVTCLHANELGLSRLSQLAPALIRLQKRFEFRFDYWYMTQADIRAVDAVRGHFRP